MNEIKIRFKSGEVGYFKLLNDEIEKVFETLDDAIRDRRNDTLEAIDLADDKRTLIDISDISTFGYSKVE
ncbi:TPA: hypothetical protein N2D99_001961 [Clostridium botulinum]|nr:hypothetical protein [Clostridium botulinum]